jgi:hypothetical protein
MVFTFCTGLVKRALLRVFGEKPRSLSNLSSERFPGRSIHSALHRSASLEPLPDVHAAFSFATGSLSGGQSSRKVVDVVHKCSHIPLFFVCAYTQPGYILHRSQGGVAAAASGYHQFFTFSIACEEKSVNK